MIKLIILTMLFAAGTVLGAETKKSCQSIGKNFVKGYSYERSTKKGITKTISVKPHCRTKTKKNKS